MPRNLANILSGPCRLTFGGADLGHTVGETRLTVTPRLRERSHDSLGPGAVDLIRLGAEVTLETRIAEWTPAALQILFPLGAAETGYAGIDPGAGGSLAGEAQALTLHPLEYADTDTSRDIVFWKAVSTGAVSVAFASGRDNVFDAAFRILPDTSKPEGERLGRIGCA